MNLPGRECDQSFSRAYIVKYGQGDRRCSFDGHIKVTKLSRKWNISRQGSDLGQKIGVQRAEFNEQKREIIQLRAQGKNRELFVPKPNQTSRVNSQRVEKAHEQQRWRDANPLSANPARAPVDGFMMETR
jgi:hypothetical protein